MPVLQRELHLHISETYRVHRRMLRTRRRWLADAQARFVRNVKECWAGEVDVGPHDAPLECTRRMADRSRRARQR